MSKLNHLQKQFDEYTAEVAACRELFAEFIDKINREDEAAVNFDPNPIASAYAHACTGLQNRITLLDKVIAELDAEITEIKIIAIKESQGKKYNIRFDRRFDDNA